MHVARRREVIPPLPVRGEKQPVVRADQSAPSFCPECGQPLDLVRPRSEPNKQRVVARRSVFVIAVGLYLAIAFGLEARHAAQTLRVLTGCAGPNGASECVGLPGDLALAMTSRNVGSADAFRARAAEMALGRDARYAAVGLIGLVVGLSAVLLRSRRALLRQLSFNVSPWLGVESLVALFFGQIVVIGAYHLVADALAGAPPSPAAVAANLDRALSTFFALAGIW